MPTYSAERSNTLSWTMTSPQWWRDGSVGRQALNGSMGSGPDAALRKICLDLAQVPKSASAVAVESYGQFDRLPAESPRKRSSWHDVLFAPTPGDHAATVPTEANYACHGLSAPVPSTIDPSKKFTGLRMMNRK